MENNPLNNVSMFDTWIQDWMIKNPPAANLQEASDVKGTAEILMDFFLNSSDNSIGPDELNQMLKQNKYVFAEGGWLVV